MNTTVANQNATDLERIRLQLLKFTEDRNWEQFHTPKNLAISISVEASELLSLFQWLNTGKPQELGNSRLAQAREEIADVLMNLIRLADTLEIDLAHAVEQKLALNQEKYPADQVRGDARKYTEY